jgi:hypothetical protein
MTTEEVLGWTLAMFMTVVHDPETKRQSAELKNIAKPEEFVVPKIPRE